MGDSRYHRPPLFIFYPITRLFALTGLSFFFFKLLILLHICDQVLHQCTCGVCRVQKATSVCDGGNIWKNVPTWYLHCWTRAWGGQKRTFQDEVTVLVEIKWQNTNTFRSIANRRKYTLPQNPERFKAWMKSEPAVWSAVQLTPTLTLICSLALKD